MSQTKNEIEPENQVVDRVIIAINLLGFILAFPLWLMDEPPAWLGWIAFGYVPFVVLFPLLSRGNVPLVRMTENRSPVAYGLVAAGLGLMLFGLFNIEVLDYAHSWLPISLVTAVMSCLALSLFKEFRPPNTSTAGMIVFLFAYNTGAVLFTNAHLDKEQPNKFRMVVTNRTIVDGEYYTDYNLVLAASGSIPSRQIAVQRALFEQCEIGDSVTLVIHRGMWRIVWLSVEK